VEPFAQGEEEKNVLGDAGSSVDHKRKGHGEQVQAGVSLLNVWKVLGGAALGEIV
jgi:hypothetical protein